MTEETSGAAAEVEPAGDPVTEQWDRLLLDPALARIGALLRAAHADRGLRARMPDVQHHALSFAAADDTVVTVVPLSNGRYVVEAHGEATPVDDAGSAVRLLTAALPAGPPRGQE